MSGHYARGRRGSQHCHVGLRRAPRGERVFPVQAPSTIWVVTRPLAEAKALVRALKAEGAKAKALPCIEREKLSFPKWPSADRGLPFLFVTSPFAAECVPWRKMRGVLVAALMPKSVEVVEAKGGVCAVTAKGGAVALAEAVAEHARIERSSRLDVLYPTSDLGGSEPEQQKARKVLATVGQVTAPVVYRTVAPPRLAEQVRKLGERPVGLVFSSPSAVRNFQAARSRARVRPLVRGVVCLGKSTARAWNDGRLKEWPAARCVASTDEVIKAVTKETRR